jgi:hypothetical protein
MIFFDREARARPVRFQFLSIPLFFAVGGIAMGVLWWMIRLGNFSNYLTIGIGLVVIGAVFGFVVALHHRFMPVGTLRKTGESLSP